MKHTFKIKKNITGFHPELHWLLILATMFVLIVLSVIYNAYLYIYAKKQVDLAGQATSETAPLTTSSFATPEKIRETFKVYEDRKSIYQDIIGKLTDDNLIVPRASEGTIASSSNQ